MQAHSAEYMKSNLIYKETLSFMVAQFEYLHIEEVEGKRGNVDRECFRWMRSQMGLSIENNFFTHCCEYIQSNLEGIPSLSKLFFGTILV